MALQVTCRCPVRFDKEKGRYVACGHQFAIRDEQAGATVSCPKCGGQFEAPAAGEASSSSGQGDAAAPGEEDELFELQPQSAAEHHTPAPSVDPPPDEDDAEFITAVAAGPLVACPECGQALEAEQMLCENCAWHRKYHPRFEELAQLPPEEDDMPGWDRWFREQLAMGESTRAAAVWGKVGLVLILFTILALIGLLLGKLAALALVVLLGVIVFAAFSAGWRFDLPSTMFLIGRSVGWRKPTWPLPKARTVDARNMNFTDVDVARLDNAKEIEALDLEGAPVTDMALPHIARMRKLQYLVLINTQVTKEGQITLQRALPMTWIWR